MERNRARNQGIIFHTYLDKYDMLRKMDKELADSYLLAMVETILGEELTPIKPEHEIVKCMLTEIDSISERNAVKYNRIKNARKEKQITEQRLDEIADMLNQGWSQSEIANQLNISQSTVSRRVALIRSEYKEMLPIYNSQNMQELCTNYSQISANVNIHEYAHNADICTNYSDYAQNYAQMNGYPQYPHIPHNVNVNDNMNNNMNIKDEIPFALKDFYNKNRTIHKTGEELQRIVKEKEIAWDELMEYYPSLEPYKNEFITYGCRV